MKAAVWRLVNAGVVEEDMVRNVSMISFRRGGNSVAAAEGVRAKVRETHGRWGLAGMVEKGLTSEAEYNSALARDNGAILRALHKDVEQHMR